MSPEVVLSGAGRFPRLPAKGLAPWMEKLVADLAPECDSVGVRFAGDRTMQRLNRDFRGKNKTTDVLSFPGGESPEGRHLGDIVVSIPTAERQAAALAGTLEYSTELLLAHGGSHCLGYKHESEGGSR